MVPLRAGGAGHRVQIEIGSHVCREPVGKGPGPLPTDGLAVGRYFRGASCLLDVAVAAGCGEWLAAVSPSVAPRGV